MIVIMANCRNEGLVRHRMIINSFHIKSIYQTYIIFKSSIPSHPMSGIKPESMTTFKREQIHIQIEQPQGSKPMEFLDFDDGEMLEEISEGHDSPRKSEVVEHPRSMISLEAEKKGAQFKLKVENYLVQNRNSIPKNLDRVRLTDDQRNGKLMDELYQIDQNQKQTEQAELFILMFNKKPEFAIADYVTKGFIKEDTPDAIAEYIIKIEGIDKAILGEYFGKNDKKVLDILHSYCKCLKFANQQFDKALRILLCKFRLPGEAQQIQRVIWQFALAFYQANSDQYDNADELFPLAYAIIMLSTDAHNPKQEKKMTCEQFVKNTRRPCPSTSEKYLSNIFDRITKEKFETQTDYFATIYGRLKDLAVSNIGEAFELSKELIKGDIFLKICKSTNKFVQRRVFLSQDELRINWVSDPAKGEEPRFIRIEDITDLSLGIGSLVMRKNKVPEEFDSLCFTITTTQRTLDLKARTTKQRGKWITYLRAILIQRRQNRRERLENEYNSRINMDVIQDMWNNDIFPFWDRHWDYKHRKPKEKGYIARGLEAICSCWVDTKKHDELNQKSSSSGITIGNNVLESLWGYGLPPASRKTLWPLIIGNNLALNPMMIQDLRRRKRSIPQLKQITLKMQVDKEIIEAGEILITMRPDLPPVKQLLLLSQVFMSVFPKESTVQAISGLANFLHTNHFLSFYRGDKSEIELRIQLFQNLMQINVPSVKQHLRGIRLQTRMFLVTWFLSLFANCFQNGFLMRIWDNFVLQGEIYLFKVGIALIKYYEIQLKMCTFNEGLKMLKFPKQTSQVLFFHILQEQIDVKEHYYEEYIEKRKHAIIKTKVQSIPLE